MGVNLTKIGYTDHKHTPAEASLPSTPISTPKSNISKIFDLDPRSPSTNIVRTPVQVIKTLAKLQPGDSPAIGEIDLDESCEVCANYDPRSPSVEFTRTPIVIERQSAKLRNKTLDNVRKQMMETTPFKTTGKSEESNSSKKSPILLESHVKKNASQNEKRNSTIGLLQTNLDYIETDLDNVQNNGKIEQKKVVLDEDLFDSQLVNEIEDEKSIELFEPIDNFVDNVVDNKKIIEDIDEEVKDIKVHLSNETIKDEPPKIDLDPQNLLSEFDKKLTNLIYEDKYLNTPVKTIPSKDGRTPLGDRNRNDNVKPKKNKLKVHDKPLKIDYTVSKIPVYKAKKSDFIQCENTPPVMKINDSRVPKSMWDTEKTIII